MPWPDPPNLPAIEDDLATARYQAELDDALAVDRAEEAQDAADSQLHRDLRKSAQGAEDALNKAVHDARLEVAKAAIDRGLSGAEFVRNAAAAIVTLYTGLLGLTYATGADASTLPTRGLAPAVLLGLALASATAYAALLSQTPNGIAPKPHSDLATFQERRLNAFIAWASGIAVGRAYFLHASVFALFFGVLLLPVAFVAISDPLVLVFGAGSLLLSLVAPLRTAPSTSAAAAVAATPTPGDSAER